MRQIDAEMEGPVLCRLQMSHHTSVANLAHLLQKLHVVGERQVHFIRISIAIEIESIEEVAKAIANVTRFDLRAKDHLVVIEQSFLRTLRFRSSSIDRNRKATLPVLGG